MPIDIHFCFWKRHVTLWIWSWTLNKICQTYTPLLMIGNKSIYPMNMGWERMLPLKIYSNLKINYDFFVKRCDIIFQACEKSWISHMYHTYAKLLKLWEEGLTTLEGQDFMLENWEVHLYMIIPSLTRASDSWRLSKLIHYGWGDSN